jgi:hypothetical protein
VGTFRTRPTAARANALVGASGEATDAGDHATARLHAEEALAITVLLGDRLGTARSRFFLGYAAIEEGDFEQARPIFKQCMRDAVDLGDDRYTLGTAFNLAWACDELGDVERSHAQRGKPDSLACDVGRELGGTPSRQPGWHGSKRRTVRGRPSDAPGCSSPLPKPGGSLSCFSGT